LMAQTLAESRHGQGEAARWDEVWGDLPSQEVQVFTRGAPRNLRQLCQRCYFEDLWELVGRQHYDRKFLEQGAGRGTTSMYLAAQGCDVTMLDLSPQGFDVAATNFAREGLRAPKFVTADARETGLPSDSYDCVYNIGLLEHFDNPKPVLDEAVRLLRPGGWLFMVIVPRMPQRNSWLAKLMLCPWRLAPGGGKRLVKRLLGRVEPARAGRAIIPDASCNQEARVPRALDADVAWTGKLLVADLPQGRWKS
jgi:SAM-dependent methyltransferase